METSVPANDDTDGQCVYVVFDYRLEGKTEVLGEKSVAVTLCLVQNWCETERGPPGRELDN
jgi:hypothetical protein